MKTLQNPNASNNKSGLDFFSIIINNLDIEDEELSGLITHIKTKLTCYIDRSFFSGI